MKKVKGSIFHKPARNKRISNKLNERERHALDNFCAKYHITNRSRFVRETLMRTVLKQFEKDAPTLFD